MAYHNTTVRASTSARPIVAEQQGGGEPTWKEMRLAPPLPGVEYIAARFGRYDELTSMCEKSPFVTFWMPSRQKFYGDPTHWLCRLPVSFPRLDT